MSQSFDALGVSASVVNALGQRDIRTPLEIQKLVLANEIFEKDR